MFAGTWSNKSGDLLHLTQCGEAIARTYVSARREADTACRGNMVVGSASGKTICFVTGAATPRMMKSWAGKLHGEASDIRTEIRVTCHSLERLTDEMDIAKSLGIVLDIFTRSDLPS